MQIEQIDPANVAALAAWHRTVVAADTAGREEFATPWQLPEVQAELADQQDVARAVFAGIDDEHRVVVSGQVGMPLRHTTQQADVAVYVHPDHRRRGHGSRMMEHLETVVRGHGRTILNCETTWPYDAPADGAGTPGAEFLRRHGFRFGIGDVMRTLDLPVDDALLDRLEADAAPHHAAYTVRSFVGPVPDDIVASYAELDSQLMVEAPTGEMVREKESADVGELRRHEALVAAQGRIRFTAVALDPAGEVVAYSTCATTAHDATNAFQWGTLVRRDHRGHRLGLAVKVAALRLLQAEGPPVPRMRTWNAEVNTHMIAVNQLLGFRPAERLGEFQKHL